MSRVGSPDGIHMFITHTQPKGGEPGQVCVCVCEVTTRDGRDVSGLKDATSLSRLFASFINRR
eukprot:39619-Chlamydomonas_euryale.AAC.1